MWINEWVAGKNLCDPSLIRANLSALEMSISHIIKHYTNVLFTVYFTYSQYALSLGLSHSPSDFVVGYLCLQDTLRILCSHL